MQQFGLRSSSSSSLLTDAIILSCARGAARAFELSVGFAFPLAFALLFLLLLDSFSLCTLVIFFCFAEQSSGNARGALDMIEHLFFLHVGLFLALNYVDVNWG